MLVPAFAPFPMMVSKAFSFRVMKQGGEKRYYLLNFKSISDFEKMFSSVTQFTKYFFQPVLTLYQTTNFRLFHTERVCRQQFSIL